MCHPCMCVPGITRGQEKVWHTEVVFVLLGHPVKIPLTGWLINNKNLFSTVLGVGKSSKIKDWSLLVEGHLLVS